MLLTCTCRKKIDDANNDYHEYHDEDDDDGDYQDDHIPQVMDE